MIIIPQSTFEFIWDNKIELTKAIRDWEYTGSQPYFDSKLFHNYLLFISQYDGITATAKLRLFYPDRSCNRIVYDYSIACYRDWETDRKSTRLNSSHITRSRMPSSA